MGEKKKSISNLSNIEHKLDILIQKQDFSSIQDAFLAIFFAILIFSVSIILYYREQNLLIWLIAHLILLYDLMILIWLLFSIFSADENDKFHYLGLVLFYILVSGAVVLVSFIYFFINSLVNFEISMNNTIAVLILLSTVIVTFICNKYLQKKYNERFYLLYERKREYSGRFLFLNNFIQKFRSIIFYSMVLGLLTTFISGLWNWRTLETTQQNHYGFPFIWMIENENTIPSFEYDYYLLFGNWIIYTLLILLIIQIYSYLKNIFRKKEMKEKMLKINLLKTEKDKKRELFWKDKSILGYFRKSSIFIPLIWICTIVLYPNPNTEEVIHRTQSILVILISALIYSFILYYYYIQIENISYKEYKPKEIPSVSVGAVSVITASFGVLFTVLLSILFLRGEIYDTTEEFLILATMFAGWSFFILTIKFSDVCYYYHNWDKKRHK